MNIECYKLVESKKAGRVIGILLMIAGVYFYFSGMFAYKILTHITQEMLEMMRASVIVGLICWGVGALIKGFSVDVHECSFVFGEHTYYERTAHTVQTYVDGKRIRSKDQIIINRKTAPSDILKQCPGLRNGNVIGLNDGHKLTCIGRTFFYDATKIVENGMILQRNIDKLFPPESMQNVREESMLDESQRNKFSRTEGVYTRMLKGVSGINADRTWSISSTPLLIGRNSDICQVTFPNDTVGVSRFHCEIYSRNGVIILRDSGASYGTKLENGIVLKEHREIEIRVGERFTVGEDQTFTIV